MAGTQRTKRHQPNIFSLPLHNTRELTHHTRIADVTRRQHWADVLHTYSRYFIQSVCVIHEKHMISHTRKCALRLVLSMMRILVLSMKKKSVEMKCSAIVASVAKFIHSSLFRCCFSTIKRLKAWDDRNHSSCFRFKIFSIDEQVAVQQLKISYFILTASSYPLHAHAQTHTYIQILISYRGCALHFSIWLLWVPFWPCGLSLCARIVYRKLGCHMLVLAHQHRICIFGGFRVAQDVNSRFDINESNPYHFVGEIVAKRDQY